MAKKKLNNKIYKKWYFWVIIASVLALIALVLVLCINNSSKVTVCTEIDYHGDIGPCIKTETVEIVAKPDKQTDCPVGTEPVYDVVGGFVGIRFVGCTRSK